MKSEKILMEFSDLKRQFHFDSFSQDFYSINLEEKEMKTLKEYSYSDKNLDELIKDHK